MKYKIGQKVWVAEFQPLAPTWTICPDCGGSGRLRVTFHDDTQVSIECHNCSVGYDPPSGQVIIRRREPSALLTTITGLEMDGTKTIWHTLAGYRDESLIFDSEEAAFLCAVKQEAAYDLEQRERIAKKEKDTRTWAWNASYHRNEIKKAEKAIEYHAAKLSVAAIRAKEDKAALTSAQREE